MKIRQYFVSNSSSSSFVCEICDASFSGWDGDYGDDLRKLRCENGHVMCSSCVGSPGPDLGDFEKEVREAMEEDGRQDEDIHEYVESWGGLKELLMELGDSLWEYENNLPAAACKICSFKELLDKDGLEYLMIATGNTREDLLSKIKSLFPTYKEFKAFLKEKSNEST